MSVFIERAIMNHDAYVTTRPRGLLPRIRLFRRSLKISLNADISNLVSLNIAESSYYYNENTHQSKSDQPDIQRLAQVGSGSPMSSTLDFFQALGVSISGVVADIFCL